ALLAEDFDMVIERVAWAESGWARAASTLRHRAREWRGAWVLVQYTALAWSARGFPLRFPQVLKILRAAGVRVGVIFHDVEPYGGKRVIDALRRVAQLRVMLKSLRLSEAAVFTVPLQSISWVKREASKGWFIPVGANLPTSGKANSRKGISTGGKLSIAVFGITGGEAGRREIQNIVEAVRFAAERFANLRLIVLGRNAQNAEAELKKHFRDSTVELHMLGVLPGEDVVRCLSVSDVMLFVRGPISTRRGSAIAGIACGLPVIAFEGPETAPPITEAGLALFSPQRKGDLGDVLLRVLQDEHYRASLAQRSLAAQGQYFSWHAIAARYSEFMRREK
ncbi:MAG TPA: glycosyltransferase, partial [Candidatus Cybelea sp.]|nr:glycosyltransferase [Candidatus Cybelea sp.]